MFNKIVLFSVVSLIAIGGLVLVGCSPEAPGVEDTPEEDGVQEENGEPSQPTQEKITWVVQAKIPSVDPRIKTIKDILEQNVATITGGNFDITVEEPGAIVGASQEWNAVQDGSLDGAMSTPIDNREAFGAVAGLFCEYGASPNPDPMVAWYMQGDGLSLEQQLIDNTPGYSNVMTLGVIAVAGAEVEICSNEPIETVEDLDGLKIRTFGDWGTILDRHSGAAVVSLPGGEVYEALQRGVIDACELSDRGVNVEYGIHEVTDYWYSPSLHAPMATLDFYVNKNSFEALPGSYKQLLRDVLTAGLIENVTKNVKGNMEATVFLQTLEYPKLLTLSEELQLWQTEKFAEFWEEKAAEDPFFAEVYTNQWDFVEQYSAVRNDMQPDLVSLRNQLGL